MVDKCQHAYAKSRLRNRYTCTNCGFVTRRYDSIDHRMERPVHPHMTVAVPGYNTVGNTTHPPKGT